MRMHELLSAILLLLLIVTSTVPPPPSPDIDVVYAGTAPLSEISVGETLSETGTLLPTAAPVETSNKMAKIPRCAKKSRRAAGQDRFGDKFSPNPYYVRDAARFRQFQSWKNVLEVEDDEDKLFTVQTTQAGYFRSKQLRFRCECKIERDQWVGSLVQVLFERANATLPPVPYSALQRLRRTAHCYYTLPQTQMVRSVANLALVLRVLCRVWTIRRRGKGFRWYCLSRIFKALV